MSSFEEQVLNGTYGVKKKKKNESFEEQVLNDTYEEPQIKKKNTKKNTAFNKDVSKVLPLTNNQPALKNLSSSKNNNVNVARFRGKASINPNAQNNPLPLASEQVTKDLKNKNSKIKGAKIDSLLWTGLGMAVQAGKGIVKEGENKLDAAVQNLTSEKNPFMHLFNDDLPLHKRIENTGKSLLSDALQISKYATPSIGRNNFLKEKAVSSTSNLINRIPGTGSAGENIKKYGETILPTGTKTIDKTINKLNKDITNESLKNKQKIAEEFIKRDLTSEALDKLGYNKKMYNGQTVQQYLDSKSLVRSDNLGGQIFSQVGQQLPSMMIGSVAGENGSLASLGISSYGGSLEEAYRSGATRQEANKYGLLNAAIEVGTEKMFAGVGGLIGKGELDDVVKERIKNRIKNATAKKLADLGLDMFGEGFEELVGDALNPLAKKLTYAKKEDLMKLYKDQNYAEDFVTAALSTLVMRGMAGNSNVSVRNEFENSNIQQNQIEEEQKKKKIPFENSSDIIENNTQKQVLPTNDKNIVQNQQINTQTDANIETIENTIEKFKEIREQTNNKIEQSKITAHIEQLENEVKELTDNRNVFAQENKTILPISEQYKTNENMTLQESVRKYGYDPNAKVWKSIEETANKRGMKALMDDTYFSNNSEASIYTKDADGNRMIVYNPNASQDTIIQAKAIHELAHDLMSSDNSKNTLLNIQEGQKISDSDIVKYVEQFDDYAKARQDLEQIYATITDRNGNLVYDPNSTEFKQLIDEEVVAHVLEAKLGNQEFVNRLNGQKPNLARRIYNWVMDKIDNLGKSSEYRKEKAYWRNVANRFEKAFNMDYDTTNAASTMYATENNNPYNRYSVESTEQQRNDVKLPTREQNKSQNKVSNKTQERNNSELNSSFSYDSEGRKLTKQQQEYFKDSKVRDENGNLEVVYHGTPADFTIFDISKSNNVALGNGLYFTNVESTADAYANNSETSGKVLKGYLNIENPINNENKTISFEDFKNLYEVLDNNKNLYDEEMGMSEIKTLLSDYGDVYNESIDNILHKYYDSYENDVSLIDNLSYMNNVKEFYEILRETTGIDGIIIEHPSDFAPYEKYYIAFNSNQFKNIDNTTPTTNEDIRYSKEAKEFNEFIDKNLTTDNQGRKLSKQQQEYFKDSKARDNNGDLITVYHTTTNAIPQFNEFNPTGTEYYRFGDQVVNYYTDSKDMSGSYASQKYNMADTTKLNTIEEAKQWLEDNRFSGIRQYDYKLEKNESNYELRLYDYDTGNQFDFEIGSEEDLLKKLKSEVNSKTKTSSKLQYEGYVNITNPYVVDAEERNWNQVISQSNDFIDELDERVPQDIKNNLTRLYQESANKSAEARENYDVINNIINQGIDGYNSSVDETVRKVNDVVKKVGFDNIEQVLNDIPLGVNGWYNLAESLEQNGLIGSATKTFIIDEFKLPKQVKELLQENYTKEIPIHHIQTSDITKVVNQLGRTTTLKDIYNKNFENYEEFDKYRYPNSYFIEQIASEGNDYLGNDLNDMFETRAEIYSPEQVGEEIAQAASVGFSKPELIRLWGTSKTTNDVVKEIIASNKDGSTNYDGVIIKNVYDYGGTAGTQKSANDLYVTFNSNQFKAVDNTTPTTDADIRYSEEATDWDEFLKKNIKSEGTQTKLKDVKLPTKEKTKLPIKEVDKKEVKQIAPIKETKIQGLEHYTTNEIKDITKDYINNILEENGYDDINVKDMDIHGSRKRGTAKANSDLDVVVQYDGDIREDDFFNMLNDNGVDNLYIDGVRVDINPIQEDLSSYMKRSNAYDNEVLSKKKIAPVKETKKEVKLPVKEIPKDPTKESTYDEKAYDRKKQHEKLIKQEVKAKVKGESQKAINIATKVGQKYLELDRTQKAELKEQLSKYTGKTRKQLTNSKTWNEIKDIVNNYAEKQISYVDNEIQDIKTEIKNTKIKIDDNIKSQITDYNDFRKDNFGKLKLSKDGVSLDSMYQELSEQYPYYFNNATTEADMLYELSDFMNKDTNMYENIKLDDATLERATTKIYNSLLQNTMNKDAINELKEEIQKKYNKRTRKIVQKELQDRMGITPEDLQVGKDISSLEYQRTDPIRLHEKVFGYKIGKKINDATINFTKHQEAERIRFLNQERNEIKDLGIKPRSKESAAVQKYGEKQYVNNHGEVKKYGDADLQLEFPNEKTQQKIKHAASVIRAKYDSYIDNINEVITDMGYDPIPKRKDYMRHFMELNDKLSQWGIPLNRESLSQDALPTDINGITDQFKPGKNWFASTMQRKGLKTTYDAITGIDGYLEGASNLMYHTESIQRYRTLSKLVRDTYGQIHGMENIDASTEEGQQRLNDIMDNKLSKYAAWLDEQANALAGKKGGIDRAAERILGRKVYTVLDAAKKQVGSNMTGFNVRSAMTNFASAVQGASKTNKLAFVKGTVSTVKNMIHNDNLIDESDFLTSRFGSDQLSKKLWQKASNAGQIFMTGTDYFTANQIWRSKYYENLAKGMTKQQAIKNADDFAARIMGDRSKGSTAEIFNSKTLGLLTQFQLEVNNQWSSIIHDNKMDIKSGNKSGATALFQLGQLAAMSYLFNNFMKSVTGSDVMIDPIDILKQIFGGDDDDKSTEEKAQAVLGDLVNDLPFVSFLTGGRIPVSEAFVGPGTFTKKMTGQKDKYGNPIKWEDVKNDAISSGFYWLLPTGYGQIKKTTKGVSMYDPDLPVAGSYTKSGNLRFTADESTGGKIKAALFGQYTNDEAKKYTESGYKTINSTKIDEMKELGMKSSEYRDYRNGLAQAGTKNEDKIDYIVNLDNVTNKQKNIMASNFLSRDFDVKDYKKYDSYEEYNYAYHNPEKYNLITQITTYDKYKKYNEELKEIRDNTKNDKKETIKYINSLNLSIPQKAMYIKTYYKSFKQYDKQIVQYVNGKNLKISEKTAILEKLGFTVRNGRVY